MQGERPSYRKVHTGWEERRRPLLLLSGRGFPTATLHVHFCASPSRTCEESAEVRVERVLPGLTTELLGYPRAQQGAMVFDLNMDRSGMG